MVPLSLRWVLLCACSEIIRTPNSIFLDIHAACFPINVILLMSEKIVNKTRLFYGAVAFILLFQWWNRFSGAPMVDFVIDDWRLWKIGLSCSSFSDALMQMLNWPDRPLGTGMMIGTYYLLGDFIPGYVILETIYTALFLLVGMWSVFLLTRDRLVVLVFGLVFSLLPNLTESFQWHTMSISYGLGYTAYLLTLGSWVSYLQRRHPGWLVLSVFSFAFALGSYEVGILMPAALLLLGRREDARRLVMAMAAFGLVIVLYLIWKFTDGMGTLDVRLFPHRDLSFNGPGLLWNAKELIRWWLGSRMLICLTNGLNGFLTLSSSMIRMLAAGNLVMGLLGLWILKSPRIQMAESAPPPFSKIQLMAFALCWVFVTNVLTLFSWTAGRMNYLPAVGVALLLALGYRWMKARVSLSLFLVMLLCMMANQGTSAQWRDSGVFHRAMYEYLQKHSEDWQKAQVVLFDTSGFRNRLTPGLLSKEGSTWGSYGNAGLMRGVFFGSMMDLIIPNYPVKDVLLDMEHEAYAKGDSLYWHGWYDPSVKYSTSLTNVYWIDCQKVGYQYSNRAK